MLDKRLCRPQVLIVSCGALITVTVGLAILYKLDWVLWIFAAVAAGAGHDPGDEIAALLKAAVVYGNLFALWGAAVPLIWLGRRAALGRTGGMGAGLIGRIASLVLAVGLTGMALIVNIVGVVFMIEVLRLTSDFLRIVSDIWYMLLFVVPPILGGVLIGVLGMLAGALAGGAVGVIGGTVVNLISRWRPSRAEGGT